MNQESELFAEIRKAVQAGAWVEFFTDSEGAPTIYISPLVGAGPKIRAVVREEGDAVQALRSFLAEPRP